MADHKPRREVLADLWILLLMVNGRPLIEDPAVKVKISGSGAIEHCHRDQGRPVATASTEPPEALSLDADH